MWLIKIYIFKAINAEAELGLAITLTTAASDSFFLTRIVFVYFGLFLAFIMKGQIRAERKPGGRGIEIGGVCHHTVHKAINTERIAFI